MPPGVVPNFYNGWAHGQVELTPAINGTALTSEAVADEVCATEFGQTWRMAEFHDGYTDGQPGGWRFRADGTLDTDGRFWVKIDDQPANPWDSDGPKPQTVIPDTTKVLGEADRAGLSAVREDGSLVFASTSPVLDSVDVGDTIASLPTPAAPDGLLRKVTGFAVEGEQVVVTTTDGLLEEAITEGELQGQATLTEADIDTARSGSLAAPAETAQGAEAAPRTEAEITLLSYTKKSFCLYNHTGKSLDCDAGAPSGLKATAAGSSQYLSLEGEVNAKAIAFINTKIRLRKGIYFDAGLQLNEAAKLVVDGKGTYSFNKSEELSQWKTTYTPVAFSIGWVPVVLTPELVPTVGASGRIEKTLHYELANTFEARHGVKFDQGWSAINEVKHDPINTSAGTTGPADVSVDAGLKGSLNAYGSRNRIYAEPKAFAQATVAPLSQTPTPSYSICTYGGLRADVGVDLPIIKKAWHTQVAEWKRRIDCFDEVGNTAPLDLTKVVLKLSEISKRGVDVNKVLPDGSYQRLASETGNGDLDITSHLNKGADTSIRISCLSHKSGRWQHTCDLNVFGTANGITSSIYNPGRESCKSCGSREEYKFTVHADGSVTED